jgi:negative regulator of flagellin synthesis FlgM
MRIDLNPSMLPELGRSNGPTDQTKTEAGGSGPALGDSSDVARLSTGSQALQQLKTQLTVVPEIRQQQVDTLKQAIQNGSYEISSQRIATAMLADSTRLR